MDKTESFINKCRVVHNGFYNYDKVAYVHTDVHIAIICPEHGEFLQKARTHLRGSLCPECDIVKRTLTPDEFIQKAQSVHGKKYDYSKVNYIKNSIKVDIVCTVHGVFYQLPAHHLAGKNCPSCAIINRRFNTEKFVTKAKTIHGDLYDYSHTVFTNMSSKVSIDCRQHGTFEQLPGNHTNQKQGCPVCGLERKSKGEMVISQYLDQMGINYYKEHRFEDCRFKNPLPFDYYLPDYKMCIEYDGMQHFKAIPFFGGEDSFVTRLQKDKIKDEYCRGNNIRLVRIKYYDNIIDILKKTLAP